MVGTLVSTLYLLETVPFGTDFSSYFSLTGLKEVVCN